ncbi:hypothetical protein OIO90_006635 [Microbotryomycetes sp. JL221]|nr:hypothetical protein OIO90_006635 [Microbotryomycetes sp. JL221]
MEATLLPVIWVQHDGAGTPIFDLGAESGDFIGTVRPFEGEKIIVKKHPSVFTGTDFHETLQSLGIRQLVITGYMAHICVTGTARSASEHGYDTIVIKDGIGDRDIPSHDGKSVVSAATLVDFVCNELGDGIGTIIQSKDIGA